MEENMNEVVETSEENNLIEAEPQETTDNALCGVYIVNANSDFTTAKKSFITGAAYTLGVGSVMATITLLGFTISNLKDKIKERKKEKKLKEGLESEIDENECGDHD